MDEEWGTQEPETVAVAEEPEAAPVEPEWAEEWEIPWDGGTGAVPW